MLHPLCAVFAVPGANIGPYLGAARSARYTVETAALTEAWSRRLAASNRARKPSLRWAGTSRWWCRSERSC